MAQLMPDGVLGRLRRGDGRAEGQPDLWRHVRRAPDAGELDVHGPARPGVADVPGHLDGEPGLADATPADHGHQSRGWIGQEPGNLVLLVEHAR